MLFNKVSQKVVGLVQTAANKILKPAQHISVPPKTTIPNGAKKLQKSMDAMSANSKAGILLESKLETPVKTTNTKKVSPSPLYNMRLASKPFPSKDAAVFLELITGKKADKSAKDSAEFFKGLMEELDYATGQKANKSAIQSAAVFVYDGKTATEKMLDRQEFKEELMKKYGKELAQRHKIEATKTRLQNKYASK